jgi:hypothetical protein
MPQQYEAIFSKEFEDAWMRETMDFNFPNESLCPLTWLKVRDSAEGFSREQEESILGSIMSVLECIPEDTRVEAPGDEPSKHRA